MGSGAPRGTLEFEDDLSRATGFTPFMIYGSETIRPIDLDYGAPRVKAYDPQGNKASLEDVMDQLDKA